MLRELKFYQNLASAIKSYRSNETTIQHYPIVGYVEPATICNLRCPSCPTGMNIPVRERTLLPYERFTNLMDEWGRHLYKLYMYNVGEPFLNKDFIRMIKYATSMGVRVVSSSNLSSKMTQSDAEELVESGLANLKIGVDGITQGIYEKYRRGGDLSLVLNNIKLIDSAKNKLASNTPVLSVAFHVFEHNEDEVPFAEEFFKKHGVNRVSAGPAFLPINEEGGIKPAHNKKYDIKAEYGKKINNITTCSWLWFALVYNPNGSISPCCGAAYETQDFSKPDAYDSLLSAFNSKKYQIARGTIVKKPRAVYDDCMGMSSEGIGVEDDSVLCERCPMPYMMDRFNYDEILTRVVRELLLSSRANLNQKTHVGRALYAMRDVISNKHIPDKSLHKIPHYLLSKYISATEKNR